MNASFLKLHVQSLRYQRNTLLAFVAILSVSLLISLGMLFLKDERIIVAPPVIEREFWVESNAVSSTYLEQFGLFVSKLIFEKSSQSARMQREIVLRHTSPSFIGALKKKLIAEEEILHDQNASYIFFPTEVKVSSKQNKVSIAGERIIYVSQDPVSKEQEKYILGFELSGSRLLLTSLEKVDG